jgi:hypothetical protein
MWGWLLSGQIQMQVSTSVCTCNWFCSLSAILEPKDKEWKTHCHCCCYCPWWLSHSLHLQCSKSGTMDTVQPATTTLDPQILKTTLGRHRDLWELQQVFWSNYLFFFSRNCCPLNLSDSIMSYLFCYLRELFRKENAPKWTIPEQFPSFESSIALSPRFFW